MSWLIVIGVALFVVLIWGILAIVTVLTPLEALLQQIWWELSALRREMTKDKEIGKESSSDLFDPDDYHSRKAHEP